MEDAGNDREICQNLAAASEISQLDNPSAKTNEGSKGVSPQLDIFDDKTLSPDSSELSNPTMEQTSNKPNLPVSNKYSILPSFSNWTGEFKKLVVEQTTALYNYLNPDSKSLTKISAESLSQKNNSMSGENKMISSEEDKKVPTKSRVSNLQTLVSDEKTRDIGLFYSLIAEQDINSFQTGSSGSLGRTVITPKLTDKNKLSDLDRKSNSSEKNRKPKSSKKNKKSKSIDSDKKSEQSNSNKERKSLESPLIPKLLKSLQKMELERRNLDQNPILTNQPNSNVLIYDDSKSKIESYFNLFKERKASLSSRESSDSGTLTPGSDDPDNSSSSKKSSKNSKSKLTEKTTTEAQTKFKLVEPSKTSKQTEPSEKSNLPRTSEGSKLTDANVGSELFDQSMRSELSDTSVGSKAIKSLEKSNSSGLTTIPKLQNLSERPNTQDLSVRPKRRDLSVRPKTQDLSVRPKTQDLSVRPKTQDLSVRPKTRDLSVRPKTRDPSVKSKTQDLSVSLKVQDSSVRSKVRPRTDESVGSKSLDSFLIPNLYNPSASSKFTDSSINYKFSESFVKSLPGLTEKLVECKESYTNVAASSPISKQDIQNCMTDLKLKQFVLSRRSFFLTMQKNAKRVKTFMNQAAVLKQGCRTEFKVTNNRRIKEIISDWLKLLHYWDLVREEINMIIETIDVLYISEENILLNNDEFHIFMRQILKVFRDILDLICLCQNGLSKYSKLCFSHDMFLFLNHVVTFESRVSFLFKDIRFESEQFTIFKKKN